MPHDIVVGVDQIVVLALIHKPALHQCLECTCQNSKCTDMLLHVLKNRRVLHTLAAGTAGLGEDVTSVQVLRRTLSGHWSRTKNSI